MYIKIKTIRDYSFYFIIHLFYIIMNNYLFYIILLEIAIFLVLLYNPDFDSFKRVKTPYASFYKGLESFILTKKMRNVN